MTGRIVRYGAEPHACWRGRPQSATQGTVWQCDCGRRYTAVYTINQWTGPGGWRRRWWPWPRAPREDI